jgi:hypothetical protein
MQRNEGKSRGIRSFALNGFYNKQLALPEDEKRKNTREKETR